MKRMATILLALVALADVVFLAAVGTGLLFPGVAQAQTAEPEAAPPPTEAAAFDENAVPSGEPQPTAQPTEWSRVMLSELGKSLSARAAKLEERERELDELLHGVEVLRRAGFQPADGDEEGVDGGDVDEAAATARQQQEAAEAAAVAEAQAQADAAFDRLQRTYAAMEPDNAAQALKALSARDKDAVVQLILSWQPRTSGAILDSLTLLDPKLAADLSYEIWALRGKEQP